MSPGPLLAVVAATLLRQGVPPPAPAKPSPRKAAWTRIEESTYEQRQAALLLAMPPDAPVLALPFGREARSWPPRFLEPGEELHLSDPWRVVARVLPRKPIHEEYLAKRSELAEDPLALVDWCRKHELDECAAFEATRRMDEIDDFEQPEYGPLLRRWLEIRDREQCPWSFPLPLEGEWLVLVDKTRHHRKKAFAAYAFDLVKREGDRAFKGQGTKLEEYYGFGQPIVAQADGVVVDVDDDFPDNDPRTPGGFDEANSVIVDYGGGVLADYAHCRKGSAKVKPGDRVERGTPLAEVGNSGASAIPHLHFSILDWGFDSIRGRFEGEEREAREGSRWVAFEGRDLETGKLVRNTPAR